MPVAPASAVLVRADGGPRLGMGHIVRCSAIAEALIASGIEVHALCGTGDEVGVRVPLEKAGARVREVGPAPREPRAHDAGRRAASALSIEEDAEATIAAYRESTARAVVLDLAKVNTYPDEGTEAGARYLERLQGAGCRTLLIDDLSLLPRHPADAIVNANLGAEAAVYRGLEPRTCLFLGARYAPVRAGFRRLRKVVRVPEGRARRIVVMLGGAGGGTLLAAVLDAIAAFARDLEITAVAGPAAGPAGGAASGALAGAPGGIDAAAGDARAIFRSAPEDLAEILASADLAVTGGGTTKYELATLGIPAILIPMSDHQIPLTAAFARAGIAADLGPGPFEAEAFRRLFEPLVQDAAARAAMRMRGRAAVDGLGAARIAAAIREEFLQR